MIACFQLILLGNYLVKSPEVIQVTNQKQAAGTKIDDAADPFTHVEAVNAEDTKKGEEKPADIEIIFTGLVFQISFALHGRDLKDVDDPANEQETEGQKINGAGDRFAVIKAMRASETKKPEYIANWN